MATKLENRSLDRGLTILEVLSRDAHCSLHELHERTALPKSTLRRLLGTLLKHHFVRRGTTDGLYRVNVVLPWEQDREYRAMLARLVEVARPHTARLTSMIKWPTNLMIAKSGRMRVADSTLALSPFEIENAKRPDWEVNIFGTAAGLAWLAALDDARVMELAGAYRNDRQWGLARFGINERKLLQELEAIRAKGYATRRPGFGSRPQSRSVSAIAVAVFDAHGPVGSLTVRWRAAYMSTDRFADKCLPALHATAAAISADLMKLP